MFNLPLIINGNKCKPIKKGQSVINVQNTCAFDSLLQLVASGIATLTIYRNVVQASSDNIFYLAKSLLEDGRLLSKYYHERALILQNLNIFRNSITSYIRGIKRLNAICNVAHLTDYLFQNEPSCISTITCVCGTRESRPTITCNINVDIILQEGLQYMQRAIDDARNISSTCRTCSTLKEYCNTYGNQIILDTSIFTDCTYDNRSLNLKHTLNSVAKTITLNDIIIF